MQRICAELLVFSSDFELSNVIIDDEIDEDVLDDMELTSDNFDNHLIPDFVLYFCVHVPCDCTQGVFLLQLILLSSGLIFICTPLLIISNLGFPCTLTKFDTDSPPNSVDVEVVSSKFNLHFLCSLIFFRFLLRGPNYENVQSVVDGVMMYL